MNIYYDKISHFLKYNNATIIIIVVIFVFGASVFASEPGREAVGGKKTSIQGVDNALLLAVDPVQHNFDFKIEKIEGDEKYYYVTYTFLDIAVVNSAWQYQLRERSIKVNKNLKEDLGAYLARELKDIREKRIKELIEAKEAAAKKGEEKRVEVTEYTGLVGKTLNLAGNIFPNYEPVKKIELPTPAADPALTKEGLGASESAGSSGADNLTQIYLDYVATHSLDEISSSAPQNAAPDNSSPTSAPTDDSALENPGDSSSSSIPQEESEDVQVIELPSNQNSAETPASEPPANAPAVPENAPPAN